MTGLPTLTHLRGYNTTHLAEAAQHWTQGAEQWDNTYLTVAQETQALDWEGLAREGALARVQADHAVVRANAAAMRAAAGIASSAASSLMTAARSVTHLADEATEKGFTVNDDYSVDLPRTANVAEFKEKFFEAERYSADLRFRAGNFMEHESTTASNLIQAVDATCDDPNWLDSMNRGLISSVIGGAIIGGLGGGIPTGGVGAIPGAVGGGALGGIGWFLHEIESDGPKCKL